MSARRKAAAIAAVGAAPLALTALAAAPAAAHGSMGDPVSRVFQCYAEGPESPRSASMITIRDASHPSRVASSASAYWRAVDSVWPYTCARLDWRT